MLFLALVLAACGDQMRAGYEDEGRGRAERGYVEEGERESRSGGGAVELSGTGWIIYRNGERTGQNMLFCASGHWEVVMPSSIGPNGNWRQSGSTLITTAAGVEQEWQVRAISSDEVELDDGSGPITLREPGPTTC
jgi:hypothetical protein